MKIVLFRERKCLFPTWTGGLAVGIFLVALLYLFVSNIHPFLSVNKPIDAKILVIEGWLPAKVLMEVANEFRNKKYTMLFSTGIPIERGEFFWQEKTYADMGAATMLHCGIDSNIVVAVPAFQVKVDRTFASACALRRLLDSTGQSISSLNVASLGTHSRRSRLLFQKALGKRINVGVYSFPDETYDPRRWWVSSNGFKTTIDEIVSYCYTKFIFWTKKRDCS